MAGLVTFKESNNLEGKAHKVSSERFEKEYFKFFEKIGQDGSKAWDETYKNFDGQFFVNDSYPG